jgi:hypothetical protein
MSNKITCTCGHSWDKSSSSKKDMKICHICGKDNTMKNGGWLDAYDNDEMQLGGYVYPVNYVPQAENGIEGTMGGLTDQGFDYNGAWGGPSMQMGGSMPGSVGFTYARTGGIPSNGPYAKKTKASAQNGMEMKFYQEGLDWKPRNISRDGSEIPQAQLGLHMLTPDYSQVGENIMEMLSVPQKALTKLFSGKYQTPSEAMNIKNPVGAFAVDAILDPANLVGGAAVSKIAKAAKSATKASKVVKPAVSSAVKNVVNKTKNLEDLKVTQQFAKQYGYELPENLERIAQSDELTNRTVRGLMDRHNTFVRGVSTNWDVLTEKNPEILRHLEGKGIDWKNNPKAAAEYMATHVPIQTGYGRASLNREVFKKGLDAIYTSNSIPTAEGYTYGQGYITKVKKPTDYSSPNRQDWITKNNPEYYEHSLPAPVSQTELDELKGWQGSDPYSMFNANKLGSEENAKKVHAWLDDFYNKEVELRKTYGIANRHKGDYHLGLDESGKEITMKHPNFQKLRRQKVEDVAAFRKKIDEVYNKTMDDTWKTLIPVDEVNFTKKLLKTEHPSNLETNIDKYAHYLHLGTPGKKVLEPIKSWEITPEIWKNKSRAHTNVYTKKLSALEKGGEITKDDNGYWNPDNWGKPVEIGSNEITMEGVYEPLLGISDTGDTQMMYPGEDYTFDGESVTEYPVMQQGGHTPLYVSDPNDSRLKNYQDSLYSYNVGQRMRGILDADKNLKPVKPGSPLDVAFHKSVKRAGNKQIDNSQTSGGGYKNYEKVGAIMKEYQGKGNKGIMPERYQTYWPNPDNFAIDLVTLRDFWDAVGVTDPRPGSSHIPQWKKPEQVVTYDPTKAPKPVSPKPTVQPKKSVVSKKPTPKTTKPQPKVETKKPEPIKKEEPIKKVEQPKPIERKQNIYEGSPVYSPGAGTGMGSALIGFANQKGDTTYIKPEDYERFAVPKYGKEFIESKKKKNGGWLEKYN